MSSISPSISSKAARKYAVVTGASRGLGRAFAEELARRGIPTLLVSSNHHISDLCEYLRRTYQVDSNYVVADLTRKEEVLAAADEINAKYEVFLLVNNAGLGGSQAFEATDIEYIDKIIQLNVTSTSLLTRALLPNLLKQGRAFVLNVSSMAAHTPIGYKMVYPASRAEFKTADFPSAWFVPARWPPAKESGNALRNRAFSESSHSFLPKKWHRSASPKPSRESGRFW